MSFSPERSVETPIISSRATIVVVGRYTHLIVQTIPAIARSDMIRNLSIHVSHTLTITQNWSYLRYHFTMCSLKINYRPHRAFQITTVYPKKYAHGFCFAVLCCGYTLTDFPISIRLTSLALWQSNDCPSASKATLMNMDKYFMWIHYERLHDHNKAKHNKTVCIFLGIYCTAVWLS